MMLVSGCAHFGADRGPNASPEASGVRILVDRVAAARLKGLLANCEGRVERDASTFTGEVKGNGRIRKRSLVRGIQ